MLVDKTVYCGFEVVKFGYFYHLNEYPLQPAFSLFAFYTLMCPCMKYEENV